MNTVIRLVILGLLLTLGACGGGGDAQVDQDEPARADPPPVNCAAQPRPLACL